MSAPRITTLGLAAILFGLLSASLAAATHDHPRQRLVSAQPSAGDRFGHAVALGSAWLAVSAPYADWGGSADANFGRVENFVPGEASWEQTFDWDCNDFLYSANDCYGQQTRYGISLSLDEAEDGSFLLAIGRKRAYTGLFGTLKAFVEVYFFDGSDWTWNPVEISEDSSAKIDEAFGESTAVSTSGLSPTAFAGERRRPGVTIASIDFGSDTSSVDFTIEGEPANLGRAVAVSGNRAAIGASGAVYLLTRSAESPAFALLATITGPDGSSGFGRSLALRGTDLVVGAPNSTVADLSDAGRAYLYDFSSPDDPVHVFEAAEPVMRERLGWAVGLGNDFVAVSAPGGDGTFEIGMTDGRVFVFDLDSGNPQIELTLETPDDSDYFGASIAVYASSVVVGAPYEDGEAGAAYVFTPLPEPGALLASLTGLATLALRARSRSRRS
jgi:hypothetical protein